MTVLDLNKTIYQLTEANPQLIEIMVSLGFKDISNPVVRRTAGKIMTLEKGCKMKGIDFHAVIVRLKEAGYN